MYEHVFWDMGGTLVDTYPALDSALAAVVRAHGGAVDVAEVSRLTRVSTGHAVATLASRFDVPEGEFEAAEDALKAHGGTDYFKAAGAKMGPCMGGRPEIEYLDGVG